MHQLVDSFVEESRRRPWQLLMLGMCDQVVNRPATTQGTAANTSTCRAGGCGGCRRNYGPPP